MKKAIVKMKLQMPFDEPQDVVRMIIFCFSHSFGDQFIVLYYCIETIDICQ